MAPNTTPPRTPKRLSNISTPPTSSTSTRISSKSPKSPSNPSSPSSKSPRNPANTHWMHEMQRRNFLRHLKKWSLSHDSCPYYHGTITVCEDFKFTDSCHLGKSVNCLLTETIWRECQKHIVVRLFAPREMDGMYRLVVRTGAGWVTAAKYFSREYFHHRGLQRHKTLPYEHLSVNNLRVSRSWKPLPLDKNAIVIRPLFHPFARLPLEVQQLIIGFAIGKTRSYEPARSRFHGYMRSTGRPLVGMSPMLCAVCSQF